VLATAQKSAGFTLIEMLITITIMTLALSLGIPSYRTWVQNTQIRNAAESIENGIQRARAEAVKCNTNVAFILGAATSWKIIYVGACGDVAASGIPAGTTLESRSSGEGSKNATVGVTPLNATTITFSSLGTVVPNVPTSATLSQVDLNTSVTGTSASELRTLRVAIGPGGNVRMCDPNLGSSSTDPRRCY